MATSRLTIYHGPVINPKSQTDYDAFPNCLIAVSSSGNIEWIVHRITSSAVEDVIAQKGCSSFHLVRLGPKEFIMPGFVDTHTHACQFPVIGTGSDMELLQWLAEITFPGEAKFSHLTFAKRMYPEVVRRTLSCGTTTCCYYGTIHVEATKVLADVAHKLGQRAFIGKCNMDQNSPDDYIESSPSKSLQDTKALIEHIKTLDHTRAGEPLVHSVITPRFVLSCSVDLMSALGKFALDNPSIVIQTHISENKAEIAEVHRLFPDHTYAGVYDKFHLLRENTILAHGVHLTNEEMQLIKERNAGLSHCPTSNLHLNSGIAKVGEWLDHGIKVGLGTDVSGGYSPSILTAVRHASIGSKVIAMQAQPDLKGDQFANKQLPIATLLYLATLGGAHVCCLEERIGSFERGKAFDALIASVQDGENPGLWGIDALPLTEITEDVMKGWLEQFMFCGDDRNIRHVIVQGRVVGGCDSK